MLEAQAESKSKHVVPSQSLKLRGTCFEVCCLAAPQRGRSPDWHTAPHRGTVHRAEEQIQSMFRDVCVNVSMCKHCLVTCVYVVVYSYASDEHTWANQSSTATCTRSWIHMCAYKYKHACIWHMALGYCTIALLPAWLCISLGSSRVTRAPARFLALPGMCSSSYASVDTYRPVAPGSSEPARTTSGPSPAWGKKSADLLGKLDSRLRIRRCETTETNKAYLPSTCKQNQQMASTQAGMEL